MPTTDITALKKARQRQQSKGALPARPDGQRFDFSGSVVEEATATPPSQDGAAQASAAPSAASAQAGIPASVAQPAGGETASAVAESTQGDAAPSAPRAHTAHARAWPEEPFEAHFAHRTGRSMPQNDPRYPARGTSKARFFRMHPRLIDLLYGLRDHMEDKLRADGIPNAHVNVSDLHQEAMAQYLMQRYRHFGIDPNTVPMYDEDDPRHISPRNLHQRKNRP